MSRTVEEWVKADRTERGCRRRPGCCRRQRLSAPSSAGRAERMRCSGVSGEILRKRRPSSSGSRGGDAVRPHRRGEGAPPGGDAVPAAAGVAVGLLGLARPSWVVAGGARGGPDRPDPYCHRRHRMVNERGRASRVPPMRSVVLDHRMRLQGRRRARPGRPQVLASAPNQLWVAGVTYVPTVQRWLRLACVTDVSSCLLIGSSMAGHATTRPRRRRRLDGGPPLRRARPRCDPPRRPARGVSAASTPGARATSP